ncbi:GerMN domain-containing protein [Quadrisphaera sp. DSM 44207]|uniref:GerMN domain-containing protein n=1 Tax=Quadrisphaera sp. DSM 44207 TaxID=1881057 RepID=UPI00088DB539|nr:GerMN domain-containing protein [Quadrisphaera sp. DSM 44207]SDQ63244.1 Sporulation and spore germination [Quadrisphaera sp. DSM 44207]
MSGRGPVAAVLAALACAVLAAALAGCSVRPQEHPEPVEVGAPSRTATAPPSGSADVAVFFVRGSRLHEVARPAPERSAQAALDQLVVGPSSAEVVAGTRTALVPQRFAAGPDPERDPATVVVAATGDLASVSGGAQLLAVAQLVWTVTGAPGVQRVRFTIEGVPVEVPTDTGLSGDPVERSDYASVAPPAAPDPGTGTATGTGTGTTGPVAGAATDAPTTSTRLAPCWGPALPCSR